MHVIERDMKEPERIMGEVMQPGGRFMLAKLGLQGLSHFLYINEFFLLKFGTEMNQET